MGETALLDAGEDQHLRALQHANRVRLARAGMKRQIAAGDLAVVDVVVSCPWQAYSMEVGDLLMSQKRWGLARCRRLLVSVGVPENKAVGTLTERQRIALARALLARERSLDGAGAGSPAPGRASELEDPGRLTRPARCRARRSPAPRCGRRDRAGRWT